MNRLLRCLALCSIVPLAAAAVAAQDDEVRQGLGLPTIIGENTRGDKMNVSGRIVLESSEKLKNPPMITVTINVLGATADRAIANSSGYYLVRNVPRTGGVTMIVEVNGAEVARKPVQPPPMGNPRYDLTIPWPPPDALNKPGVIDASPEIKRSSANEELFQRAVSLSKAGDTAKAVAALNQLLAADPKDFVAWTEMGTLYFKANSLDNAEACYFKAIEQKKDYFPALLNLGKLYLSRKRYDNAVLVLSNAVKVRPQSAEAHYFIGETYLQNKKGSSAVVHFNEALKLDPIGKSDAHLRLAALYDAANLKDKAAAEYKALLQKMPDHPEKARFEKYIADNLKK